jgi:cytochrome P450
MGQMAFGYGTLACIGAPVVRMEMRVLLERLIERFPRWKIAGTQRRIASVFRSGWHELPLVVERP